MTAPAAATVPTRLARLALLALLAIAPAPATAAPWGGDGGRVEIEVRERPADAVWEVRYRLADEAAGVEFLRARGAFRDALWAVAPAGSTWASEGGVERLCFPAPARAFAASFRAGVARRPGDVAVDAPLGDGGRLLSTAHLRVRPLAACAPGVAAEGASPRHRFRFLTDDGRAIRARDRSGEGSLAWSPEPAEEETWVLFGAAPLRESARATLALDPRLPEWLVDRAASLLPPLLDRFAAETGIALPGRPILFVGFDPTPSGRSVTGGALPHALLVSVAGDGWAAPSPEGERDWLLGLARATLRLWVDAAVPPDAESAWLVEAAAELFALRAAWGLGAIDYPAYEAALVDAANACLVALDAGPLLSAAERGAGAAWPTCGPVLLFAADRAVERGAPGQGGIALLYRRMLEEGLRAGGRHGTGLFLGWLDRLSGERDTVHALQRILRRGVPRAADVALHDLLAGAGVEASLVPVEDAGDSPALRLLLREGLTRCACGTASPESSADPDCARFAGGNRLGRVGGVDVATDAPGAYGRFRAASLLGRPLEVVTGADAGAVVLLCPRDVLETRFERLLRHEPAAVAAPAGSPGPGSP